VQQQARCARALWPSALAGRLCIHHTNHAFADRLAEHVHACSYHIDGEAAGLSLLVCAAISLCGQRQALRHALGLVGEMRARGTACNTHTYSALKNVAIKCGELELALDVFHQLQVPL